MSSAVGPSKRISPRSMKKQRCGQAQGAVQALLHQDHRGAGVVDAPHHAHEALHVMGARPSASSSIINRRGRVIIDPRQGEHLLLAARERAGRLVQPLRASSGKAAMRLVDGLPRLGPGPARSVWPPMRRLSRTLRPGERHLPPDQEGDALVDDLLGLEVGRVHAEEPDDPPVRVGQARDGAQQRGLAGAVGPEQRHHLALFDLEVDVEEDLVRAVEEVEVVDLQRRDLPAGLAPLALGVALDHVLDHERDVPAHAARADDEQQPADGADREDDA